jgi:hypothetical protein
VLTDGAARWLLVLHTALGVAAVGAATHLVIWLRRYLAGRHGKRRAVQRFAVIALVCHLAAFIGGNVLYPTYKVEVRAAYLENTAAIAEQASREQQELERIAAREGTTAWQAEPVSRRVRDAGRAARWFDVKEHWVALGLFGSAGLVLVLAFWDPRRDGLAFAPVVMGLAVVVAGTVWLGAIIGVLTSAWRAV